MRSKTFTKFIGAVRVPEKTGRLRLYPFRANALPHSLYLRIPIRSQLFLHPPETDETEEEQKDARQDANPGQPVQAGDAFHLEHADASGKKIKRRAEIGEQRSFVGQPGSFERQPVAEQQFPFLRQMISRFRHTLFNSTFFPI